MPASDNLTENRSAQGLEVNPRTSSAVARASTAYSNQNLEEGLEFIPSSASQNFKRKDSSLLSGSLSSVVKISSDLSLGRRLESRHTILDPVFSGSPNLL